MAVTNTNIRENFQRIQERIARAATKAGRNPEEITLVGVSKTHPASAIAEALAAGVQHFGENRVQEWEEKRRELEALDATWHLIGHLQSNKAGRAARIFGSVDSVDEGGLGEKLDRHRRESGEVEKLRVLIEVHLGGEESKSGISETDLPELAEKLLLMEHLQLEGLMCIPPFMEKPEQVRPYFARLRELREQTEQSCGQRLPVLSMGMSHDFEAAILEGATEVRLGTALFGIRPAAK
jgi:PLP dependent protein